MRSRSAIGDADAGVGHLEHDVAAGVGGVEAGAAADERARGQLERAARRHGLDGVDAQVQADLLQLVGVAEDDRRLGRQERHGAAVGARGVDGEGAQLGVDARDGELVLEEVEAVLGHRVQVDGWCASRPGGARSRGAAG